VTISINNVMAEACAPKALLTALTGVGKLHNLADIGYLSFQAKSGRIREPVDDIFSLRPADSQFLFFPTTFMLMLILPEL